MNIRSDGAQERFNQKLIIIRATLYLGARLRYAHNKKSGGIPPSMYIYSLYIYIGVVCIAVDCVRIGPIVKPETDSGFLS